MRGIGRTKFDVGFRDLVDVLMQTNFSVFWVVRAPAMLSNCRKDSEKALEIGCGTGNWTGMFASQTGMLVSLDVNPEKIRINRDGLVGRNIQNVSFLVASGDALPFPSGTFDKVLCIDVIEHIPDDHKAMAEISRILEVSGCATLTTMLENRPSYLRKTVFDDHVREYSQLSFTRLFTDAGLEPVKRFTFYSFFSTIARELEMMYSSINQIPFAGVAFRALLSLVARLDRLGQIGAPSGIGIISKKPQPLEQD